MAYKGIIKKSRTLDFAAIKGAIGAAIAAYPQVVGMAQGEGRLAMAFGIGLLLFSLVDGYLRHMTTGSIGEK
jgi:hypothetical protein